MQEGEDGVPTEAIDPDVAITLIGARMSIMYEAAQPILKRLHESRDEMQNMFSPRTTIGIPARDLLALEEAFK